MEHVKSILAKFIVYSVIQTFVFVFYGFSISFILLMSLFLAVVTYVLGDLIVLPLRGNITATIGDGGIIFLGVLLWTAPSYGFHFSLIGGALFVAFLLSVCEWFIHIYVIGRATRDDREPIYD